MVLTIGFSVTCNKIETVDNGPVIILNINGET